MSRLAWLVFLTTFAYALWLYPQLPDRIPMHFGPDGTPDVWGARGTIFLSVGLSLFMQVFLTVIPKFGASLSPKIRTSKDPAAELAWATRFIEGVRGWIAGLFLVLLWSTASVATGNAQGLGWVFFSYVGIGLAVILAVAMRGSQYR